MLTDVSVHTFHPFFIGVTCTAPHISAWLLLASPPRRHLTRLSSFSVFTCHLDVLPAEVFASFSLGLSFFFFFLLFIVLYISCLLSESCPTCYFVPPFALPSVSLFPEPSINTLSYIRTRTGLPRTYTSKMKSTSTRRLVLRC